MEASQIHILLNHYPVIGWFIGILLILIGYALRNDQVKRNALLLLVIMAVITIPVFITGEMAGGAAAEWSTGDRAKAITMHKHTARTGFGVIILSGVLAGAVLLKRSRTGEIGRWAMLSVLMMSLVSAGVIGYATHLGRQIKWNMNAPSAEAERENASAGRIKILLNTNRENILWHA